MNKYGLIAQQHWQRHCPSRYATLDDPEEFFDELGETAATQIEQLQSRLEAQLPADLPYVEHVGQLRSAQLRAEEIVLADLVYSSDPECSSLMEELEQLLSGLPSAQLIQDALAQAQQDAEDEAERDGRSSAVLTDEQQERCDRLSALLPLVTCEPSQLNEAELMHRIQALREFGAQGTGVLK
ncbi:hypothetical protein GCM10027568_34480 [Humibacter soli]